MLPNMRSLIKKHLPVLYSDSDLKNVFPENSICTVLREIEFLKKYYLHHCTLKIKMKRNLMS